jgi:hypothetical protein
MNSEHQPQTEVRGQLQAPIAIPLEERTCLHGELDRRLHEGEKLPASARNSFPVIHSVTE